MHRNLLRLLPFVVVFLASWLLFFKAEPAPYIQNGEVQIQEATERWKKLIVSAGPQRAHDLAVEEIRSLSPDYSHVLAHTLGEALYQSGGNAYASYCGTEFIYGCYHQIMGLAMAEHGSTAAHAIATECKKTQVQPRACAHGLGHALVAYRGYTQEDLEAAIKDCRAIVDTPDDLNGCVGGASMEYNLREILSGERDSMRPLVMEQATEPCTKLAKDIRQECAYHLPLWWRTLWPPAPKEEVYARMGGLCRSMGAKDLSDACFAGIGVPTAWFEKFDPQKIAKGCSIASDTREERFLCIAQAAQSFRTNDVPHENVCAQMSTSDEETKRCEQFVRSDQHANIEMNLHERGLFPTD